MPLDADAEDAVVAVVVVSGADLTKDESGPSIAAATQSNGPSSSFSKPSLCPDSRLILSETAMRVKKLAALFIHKGSWPKMSRASL